MSLIILKEEGKERETEQQQLNPNIALYTFGYAGGQHTHFFSYFKKKLVSNTKGDWTAVTWQVTLIGKICKNYGLK